MPCMMLKKHFYNRKHQDQMFAVGDMVLLLTNNLTLPTFANCNYSLWALPSDVYRTWYLLPGSSTKRGYCSPIGSYQSLKPAGPQPAGSPALVDDSYKVEAILQINKHGIHTKVKWVGYDSSQNQWIQLCELQYTAPEVVKAFLRERSEKDLV